MAFGRKQDKLSADRPLHCKGATSCFSDKHLQRRWRKFSKQKELYLAQRRGDAEFEMGSILLFSASLRESTLVAAEGRSKLAMTCLKPSHKQSQSPIFRRPRRQRKPFVVCP
jgi:hypothetical protein